jgi:hypothetical protein
MSFFLLDLNEKCGSKTSFNRADHNSCVNPQGHANPQSRLLDRRSRLKKGEITCEDALRILVDKQGIVNLDLLDSEVSSRFFREVPNRSALPPVIPLLLWRNCYYLGSPVSLPRENIQKLSASTLTAIKIIPIADKSYRAWYLTRSFNANSISAASLVNPITGETEPEDISEVTELYLKKGKDSGQQGRAPECR